MSFTDGSGDWLRITMLLDESLEQWLLEQALELGAVGYICTSCSGKPPHAPFEDPRSGRGLVRMELLARSAQAGPLLDFVQQLPQSHYPVTSIVDTVKVYTEEQALAAVRAP